MRLVCALGYGATGRTRADLREMLRIGQNPRGYFPTARGATALPVLSYPPLIASCASRLCRTHRHASIFVDFNHIASGVFTAREALETLWALGDDRVGIGASLDHVALFDLLVKEHVETFPARA